MAEQHEQALKKTPLNQLERDLGGKMVDFGGWDLPVQFSGILGVGIGGQASKLYFSSF